MPGPSPRYAAFEMPLSLRRRQRTTTDPEHAARAKQVTEPATQPADDPRPEVTTPHAAPATAPGTSSGAPASPAVASDVLEAAAPAGEIRQVGGPSGETLSVESPAPDPGEEHPEIHHGALVGAPAVVMVLGDSSPEGTALVLALSRAGHEVVSVEHDRTAAGLRLAQLGAVIPDYGSERFQTALLSVARNSGATALLAVHPEAMQSAVALSRPLSESGTRIWAPGPELFRLCGDRSAFYDVLASSGLPVEKTGLGPIENEPVRGRQFSVDVVADRDYEVVAAVSSWRVAATGDITTVAETFSDARLLDLLRAVCAALRVEGPAVVQGYVSITGRAWLTSVQPGFSPLLPLAGAAGVDIVDLALAGTLGVDLPGSLLPHRSGVRMIQYLDQVFEG